jgi:putative DNA primase/helicase
MTRLPSERTYLAVPFAEKDEAKALGARWHHTAKAWFVPAGADPQIFARWILKEPVHVAGTHEPQAQFADALRLAGLLIKELPIMDGKLHRVPVEGDRRGETSGAGVGYLDGHPAGFIQNFRAGIKETWKASGWDGVLDERDRAGLAAQAAQHHDERLRERALLAARVAEACAAIFAEAQPARAEHPYLARKGVAAYGLGQGRAGQGIDYTDHEGHARRLDLAGKLLVPVRDETGQIASLQAIDDAGHKIFVPGGAVTGNFHTIGDHAAAPATPLIIAEGYSTAATIHDLAQAAVIVAFSAGNLLPVARIFRKRYPDRLILLAGDNDHLRESELDLFGRPKTNVGRAKTEEAAAAIAGHALLPSFTAAERGSDWNDLVHLHGRDAALRTWNEKLAGIQQSQAKPGTDHGGTLPLGSGGPQHGPPAVAAPHGSAPGIRLRIVWTVARLIFAKRRYAET